MAAKFQFEELSDTASARTLLHQGIRTNRTSHLLWLEASVESCGGRGLIVGTILWVESGGC
jgi:hypothetical protein